MANKKNTPPGIGESADSGVMHNPLPSRARTHARVVDRRDIKDIPCSQTTRACTCTRTRTRVENPAAYFKAWRIAKWGGDYTETANASPSTDISLLDEQCIRAAVERVRWALGKKCAEVARAYLNHKNWRSLGIPERTFQHALKKVKNYFSAR